MSLNGGYAMIKYNSTQEELQIAYRSKKPALFYDENQRAHWAVIEETATESVDEETQEQITLYKYSYRLLDEESGGSLVIANPTLSGDEATLNGLEVDGTKYKVGGGSGTITLDDIVDANGNKRFVSGEMTFNPNNVYNFTEMIYSKWSLSGTHIMFVGIIKAKSNAQNFIFVNPFFSVTLPDYINDKIVEVSSSNRLVLVANGLRSDGETFSCQLRKTDTGVSIVSNQQLPSLTIARIQFDLLIDVN